MCGESYSMVKRRGPDPVRAEVQLPRAFAHAVVFLLAVAAGLPRAAEGAKDKTSTKPAGSERAKKPEAQWQYLQARVSPLDEYGIPGGWVSGQSMRTRRTVPKGLALPDGMGEDVRFAVWRCPRTKKGRMLLAIAKSGKDGSHDTLWVDSDFDGSLADEEAINRGGPAGGGWHVELGLPGKSGPALHKLGLYLFGSGGRSVFARSEIWREGTVEVGGAERKCTLVDFSGNGSYNDVSMNFKGSDRIRIETGGEWVTYVVGRYIDIDGVLYRLDVIPDGSKVSFTPAKDVPMAAVSLPKGMAELVVYGETGTYYLRAEKGALWLPAGRHRVESWTMRRKDEAAGEWQLTGRLTHDTAPLVLKPDKKPKLLDVGEPVVGFLSVIGKEGHHTVSGGIRGRRGERLYLVQSPLAAQVPGSATVKPRIRIRSSDGEYDQSFEVAGQWGGRGESRRKGVEWWAPEGTAGPFTVTVEVDGPFKLKARKHLIRDARGE